MFCNSKLCKYYGNWQVNQSENVSKKDNLLLANANLRKKKITMDKIKKSFFFMKYEMFYRFVTGSWKINQMIWALKKKRVNSANSSVNSQHKSATRQMVLRYHVCHFDKGFSSSSPQFFGTRWVPENTQEEEVALSLFPFITGKNPPWFGITMSGRKLG